VTASLVIATLVFLPFGVAQAPSVIPSAEVVVAVVLLGVVCTAVAFLIFFKLIAEIGAARATVITYVNPAVAVLLGVLVLDEPFTMAIAIGSLLVLAGSVLATAGAKPATRSGEQRVGGSADATPDQDQDQALADCRIPEP
jgi:drug/metabolite transporter (DMT)-like permease